ncbi:hypothetical protein Cgig2_006504 [Carnegiea gigantea]|uniref:NPH3 domain-containing protein n=1 Tax=Carnegiea gigantea TaxID=171969 RepID=A0A9Q1JJ74_9CARY|nr:hypothetical protein Cgig2_006504 [Carnegiea gigantea]
MKNKFVGFEQKKSAMLGRRSYNKKASNLGDVLGERHNRCVMVPAKVNMTTEAIERREHNWCITGFMFHSLPVCRILFVRTKFASDLVIQIGNKSSFHLHIVCSTFTQIDRNLPMVSRSAQLNRIIFEQKKTRDRANNTSINIRLDNLPGGAEIFEIIVKFCYGWKVDLTANNAAPLYCAADFLEMTDEIETSNLIFRTESFLSFIIFSSWKDTFLVLKTCEAISPFARDLLIQRRCCEAIAWKVCADPKGFNFLIENESDDSYGKTLYENWWFEDASTLRIDHFIEVVAAIKRKGIKADVLGSCIAYWTAKWLSKISFGIRIPTQKSINTQVRRVIVESLIKVLPAEENSVFFNFLLHLLKVGSMTKIDGRLSTKLEKRVASCLEQCQPLDLLMKNYGESETLYDVGIVARAVETYVSMVSKYPGAKMFVVGRLMDGYLSLMARDENLSPHDFRMLADSLPKNARYSDDNLYRVIDRYLKAHPNLTEEKRKGVCRALEYHKLSKEAREHAMKNDRLPFNITTQFISLKQVNMVKSMVDPGSLYRRTKDQMIMNVNSESCRECMKAQKEMKMMKREVESMKMELNKLQLCKLKGWLRGCRI